MSNHQKRLSVPKSWPVERKTETFTVKADAGPHGEAGVPLLIVLRDVLGYADSRKEARYALGQDSVLINGTAVSDEERPVGMFDILAFTERDEYYRVFPDEGGRLSLTPIDAESAGSKLGKVVTKQYVSGGSVQLTLHDGQTLVVDTEDYDTGDSLVVATETSETSNDAADASDDEPRAGEIVAHFEYAEGALVTAVNGEHAGEVGRVDGVQVTPGSADNIVQVEQDEGDSEATTTGGGQAAGFETVEDYVVVIDENFIEDAPDEADTEADGEATDDTEADGEATDDTEADGEAEEADADGGDEQ
jgi:small subunit ribosomal protein S4e